MLPLINVSGASIVLVVEILLDAQLIRIVKLCVTIFSTITNGISICRQFDAGEDELYELAELNDHFRLRSR